MKIVLGKSIMNDTIYLVFALDQEEAEFASLSYITVLGYCYEHHHKNLDLVSKLTREDFLGLSLKEAAKILSGNRYRICLTSVDLH